MHHNFQPAKTGLFDQQIAQEKHIRLLANTEYREFRHLRPNLMAEGLHVFTAADQHAQLRYSDRGDFTRCYRGGF